MWRGHEEALASYGLAIVDEWLRRGGADTCGASIVDELGRRPRSQAQLARLQRRGLPAWLGDEAFHRAHRSNLLRKDPEWYGRMWPEEPDDLEYVWPVRSTPGAGRRPTPAP
jgi:Pyrimidine dimer DNA glycosylase